jgi:hypothetical protein
MQVDVAERAALTADLRAIALAHLSLDEIGVPREIDGRRLNLFGRIEALRAGKFDPDKLTVPTAAAPFQCASCGLLAGLVVDEQ